MKSRRSRLAAVLRLARTNEDRTTAAHERRLREIANAREMFIAAQHRARPQGAGSVDELRRQRTKSASSARAALAAESHLQEQIERSIEERNDMLAAMRHRRTVERIDEKHSKAWANLASQAAERALDDLSVAAWRRRNP
jgi:flagellar biosynthesis chaperone FliJ